MYKYISSKSKFIGLLCVFVILSFTKLDSNEKLSINFITQGSYRCIAKIPVLEKELRMQLLDSGGTVLLTDFLKKGFGYNKKIDISRLEINRYYFVFKDDKQTLLFSWDCGEIEKLVDVANDEVKNVAAEYLSILKE
ncbi:MAG: hypothetical protein ACPHXR_02180 [Flavicella sp.]